MKRKRFVILDRDGTVIVEKNYLSDPDHIALLPKAAKSLKELKKLGLGLIIITNQSGVGKKYFDLKTLEKIHDKLTHLLSKRNVVLDDIYFCPHTPEDNCLCRKPKVALVEKAIKKHHFDPTMSFVIGDKKADIELGEKIGATTILVRTGYRSQAEKEGLNADYTVDDLSGVISIIRNIL